MGFLQRLLQRFRKTPPPDPAASQRVAQVLFGCVCTHLNGCPRCRTACAPDGSFANMCNFGRDLMDRWAALDNELRTLVDYL